MGMERICPSTINNESTSSRDLWFTRGIDNEILVRPSHLSQPGGLYRQFYSTELDRRSSSVVLDGCVFQRQLGLCFLLDRRYPSKLFVFEIFSGMFEIVVPLKDANACAIAESGNVVYVLDASGPWLWCLEFDSGSPASPSVCRKLRIDGLDLDRTTEAKIAVQRQGIGHLELVVWRPGQDAIFYGRDEGDRVLTGRIDPDVRERLGIFITPTSVLFHPHGLLLCDEAGGHLVDIDFPKCTRAEFIVRSGHVVDMPGNALTPINPSCAFFFRFESTRRISDLVFNMFPLAHREVLANSFLVVLDGIKGDVHTIYGPSGSRRRLPLLRTACMGERRLGGTNLLDHYFTPVQEGFMGPDGSLVFFKLSTSEAWILTLELKPVASLPGEKRSPSANSTYP